MNRNFQVAKEIVNVDIVITKVDFSQNFGHLSGIKWKIPLANEMNYSAGFLKIVTEF